MRSILHDFLLILIPLFVVVNPAGSVPLFIALTGHFTDAQRRHIALRASTVAAVTAILFVILGQAILSFLGVQFADFQIAGGLLLAVLAIIDLLIRPNPEEQTPASTDPSDSVGIVPLGVPLIVGPATMTTSLLLVNTYSPTYNEHWSAPYGQILVTLMVCTALLINLALVFVAMFYSNRLIALVGHAAMTVISKIVMILLTAIAISLIRHGIVSIVHDLQVPTPTTQSAVAPAP
jgi:multiple antibiotic resistance protein